MYIMKIWNNIIQTMKKTPKLINYVVFSSPPIKTNTNENRREWKKNKSVLKIYLCFQHVRP